MFWKRVKNSTMLIVPVKIAAPLARLAVIHATASFALAERSKSFFTTSLNCLGFESLIFVCSPKYVP
jgi:hypothetical protein